MSELNFTKMHGLGNDFVMLKGPLEITTETIATLCDRHTGIGADGLIIVSTEKDFVKMEYWNADGSVAEMCGNGLRCVTRFAVENKLAMPGIFSIQTGAGMLEVSWSGKDEDNIEVQVGKVVTEDNPINIQGEEFYIANVGNPHAITIVPDTDSAPVTSLGPKIEIDAHFPNKTNVEFVQIVDESHAKLRIWERGVGETLACGTGMVSTAMVLKKLGKTKLPITVEVPGGKAFIQLDDEGYSRISGPAVNVFNGSINI